MMKVVEEINALRLDLLDQLWVQGIYYSEFLEFGEFPPEYESVLESLDIRKVFRSIMNAIDAWLQSGESSEEKSWASLSHHVEHEKLLALLAYYIDYGTKNVTTKEYRNNTMLACRVYYKLLSIPGYKAYHIYHSQLFAHSLACLGFPKAMCDHQDNYYNTKELTREVNSIIRELQFFVLDLRVIIDSLQLSQSDMNFEDILSNLVDVTGGAIVNRLDVDKIELTNIMQLIYEIIDILICDADREPNSVSIRMLFKSIFPKLVAATLDNKSPTNLVRASYVTYSSLLLLKYGKAAITGYTVMLEHLCFMQEGLERAEVRQARATLVAGMMSILPAKSYRKIIKWLIKLSTTSKILHRHIAMELLSKLMSNDPEEETPPDPEANMNQPNSEQPTSEETVTNKKTSDETTTNQSTTDQITMDQSTSGQQTSDQPTADQSTTEQSTTEQSNSDQPITDKPTTNTTTSDQSISDQLTTDQSTSDQPAIDQSTTDLTTVDQPTIALPISDLPSFDELLSDQPALDQITSDQLFSDIPMSDLLNPEQPEVVNAESGGQPNNQREQMQQDNKQEKMQEENLEVKPSTPKDQPPKLPNDESSQDSQDSQLVDTPDHGITEEDVTNLIRQRAHTAPHAELLRAVYERLNDVSSTLRARAFQILTECIDSDRASMRKAIEELNGCGPVSRLMAMAARGVCDERACVRRAALSLVHRSLARVCPQPNDLGILVGLCRDASIIVRSAAISALGDLALNRPGEAVFDAFLNGPFHQLSDPETKVADQVVNLLQQILIDRLKKYSEGASEDLVPWMFLAGVVRHNMRRHLQKACLLLSKAGNGISHRLVDILSTHLGALNDERDLHTLVLLTSVAKHVNYKEVGFIIDYYYKIAEDPELHDARIMALTLELCDSWARWMRLDDRTALRTYLVKRLASSDDDGCRLACASLAANLDPLDLTWATELMQLSERAALGSNDVQEWLRAADLSLVAPVPPAPTLVRLFLTAVSDPPIEWTEECMGLAVAGLGRLCVRDRDTAAAAAPIFASLLRPNAAPLAAQLNSLLALTDITIRYTCIVEPLMDEVCACVGATAAPEMRRACARALTRLLLAGYLRLRTPLYYRYCALLADEDHDVREPAEYYVTCCLTPEVIYHHFVDCVLHYNNDDPEINLSFDARQLIYDVMLQRLSIVQKLNLQCRLAREILQHAADLTDEGDGEIPPNLNAALLDTITLLCGPRMKLPKKPQRDPDAGDMEDLHERVTTNIVSHKMKRTVAEVVVPAVLRLHSRVRSQGGQLVTYLVRIANDLLHDYRQEIEELIENDEELVQSVRQFQEIIGSEPSFGIGNTRNLVTSSTTNEPETPKASRKRPAPRSTRSTPRKRALRI